MEEVKEKKEVVIKTDKLSKSFSIEGKQQHIIKNIKTYR